jgi:hypothetical protein
MTAHVRAFRDWLDLEYALSVSDRDRLMAELKVYQYSPAELKGLRELISENGIETESYNLEACE